MEKRLLVAFVLSFLVLTVWSQVFPKPQPAGRPSAQGPVSRLPEAPALLDSTGNALPLPAASTPEKIEILENSKIRVEFSNKGGTIKSVVVKEFESTLPVTSIVRLDTSKLDIFRLDTLERDRIVYTANYQGHEIQKEYKLSNDDYTIHAKTSLRKSSNLFQGGAPLMEAFRLDTSRLDTSQGNGRDKSLLEYSVALPGKIYRKSGAFHFNKKEAKSEDLEAQWFGFRGRYYCLVVKPLFLVKRYEIDPIDDTNLAINYYPADISENLDETQVFEHLIYFGPQKLSILRQYNEGIDHVMVFSNWWFLDMIAMFIYSTMNFIHTIIPNWGICIILISLLVYGSMYPLTMKAMLAMRKTQALQPQINKMREQYKDNPQRLNKEIMEFYKKHKINPLGGCLPFLFQMPVFIGLYQVLWRSVSFKGAHFLWIKDLSLPDRLFIFPANFPVIGNEFNLLPLVMVVIMVFQQKISAKNMATTDPAQQAQQKMMMTILPVFLGFVFYKFASGLTLYFTMFYLLSTLTQWKTSKMATVVAS